MAERMPPRVVIAFQDYYGMGPKRDIKSLAERYRAERDESVVPIRNDAELLEWWRKYRWDEECDRMDGMFYDVSSTLLPRDKAHIIAHRLGVIEQVRTAASLIMEEFISRLAQGIDYLSTMEVAKLVKLSIQAIEVVNREERLEFGEATSNVAIHSVVERVVQALPIPDAEKIEVRDSIIRQINMAEEV